MNGLEIREVRALPDGILALEAAAIAEGFRFLTRLVLEWENGSNRFDQPGDCLLGVWREEQLIAIGGLSRDPHVGAQTGRLRRLYVAPAARRQGVGEALVQALLARATQHFACSRIPKQGPHSMFAVVFSPCRAISRAMRLLSGGE